MAVGLLICFEWAGVLPRRENPESWARAHPVSCAAMICATGGLVWGVAMWLVGERRYARESAANRTEDKR
jgi:hypothetical protein